MVSRAKRVLTYLWICTLQVHSMPTSVTNFKDPAFGPYFELSTRQSLKPTTTIDYDLADFDEFGNDPGLYDVVGSPDAVNPDPDADQGLEYPGSIDTGVAPSLFEPLYTKIPNGVTAARGSGGISDEDRARLVSSNRYKPGNGQAYSTSQPGNDQNEPQIDAEYDNTSPDKQISSTENANQQNSSTKSANGSNHQSSIENGTESERHTANDMNLTTTETQPNGNIERSSVTPQSNNRNVLQSIDSNNKGRLPDRPTGKNASKTITEANAPTKTGEVQSKDKSKSDHKLSNSGHVSDTDESSSRDLSSESTSRDVSSPNNNESNETKFASVSGGSENSGGSASESASVDSFERSSGETSSGENPTYRNKQNPSSLADITTENDSTRDQMLDIGPAETTKLIDLSDDANSRSYDTSTSNESGNSASDETGSSTSNESGSEASGRETSREGGSSASDEGGDDNTGERSDSASNESGGDSSRERAESTSVESIAYVGSGRTNSMSDEMNDNASIEAGFTANSKTSSTKVSDEHYSGENSSDSHDRTSSEYPEVNSNEGNSIESSGSKSNISTKDDDESVSYEVLNSFGDPSTINEGLKMSDENSNLSSKGNGYWRSNKDTSESKSSKLADCFRQTSNNTDCLLLRSLHSICKNQFTSKCSLGVNRMKNTKLSHSASSSSGSVSFGPYGTSSESTDADDPFSDSVEANDSAMDSNSNSLSLATIENLSASYEKANGILEVIMLIKEACPSICGLAESAEERTDVNNGRGSSLSPAQDSSESSDEDDLSTDTNTDTINERASSHLVSSKPSYTGYSSENNSVDVIIDKSSGGSSDDSHYSSDASNDYSFENYSASDNTSK